MAGWGDDPELERLRSLIDDGWTVVEITEDPKAPGGPADTVTVEKDDRTESITSDHLAFHRYVEFLREDQG
ncbi:MAG: hypothetical protein GEU78_04430 [Actinobacteria bacterium]|nr:hypothetical protein [Actinomycetota bacterium]